MNSRRFLAVAINLGLSFCFLVFPPLSAGDGKSPVKVKIQDDKPVVIEAVLPLDPKKYVEYLAQANMGVTVQVEKKMMHLGQINTLFKIDGQVIFPGNAKGKFEKVNAPLPKTAAGKERDGKMSVYVYDKLRITQTVEVVPSKPAKATPGQKRRLDTVLVRTLVENQDTKPHTAGMRVFMDVFIVQNDGALFAAPNHPDKILDGVELKDKLVPDYLQILENSNLKNPGFVAHLTYNFGKSLEKPNRVALTSLRAGRGPWDIGIQPAGGDSAMAFFWDPKPIPANGKREMLWAYGGGIAGNPENEGLVGVVLGGSFEPGKLFTIAASVNDPSPGQTLTLELPDGMQRVEGKESQSMPAPSADSPGLVLWKARVLRTGQFTLRVRSSNGITQTKIITISPSEKK